MTTSPGKTPAYMHRVVLIFHKSVWWPGHARTCWGAYSAPQTLAGLRGKEEKGRAGMREREGREKEGKAMKKGEERTISPPSDYLAMPVQYRIAVLTFKVFHDSAPRYLGPLITVADLPGRRALRSASTRRLVAPPIKLSTVDRRAFPVAAAQVWNGLPEGVVSSSSLQTFRRQLKTHLFQLSYPHLIFNRLTGIVVMVLLVMSVI